MKKTTILILKMTQIGLAILFVINLTSVKCLMQEKELFEWERIVLLDTKKAEVEESFGKPEKESKRFSFYNIKSGRLIIFYYGAQDTEKAIYKCNAVFDMVLSYEIIPSKSIIVSTLPWDLNRFEKNPGDDGRYVYSSLKKGISFSVERLEDGQEKVHTIRYDPSADIIEKKCTQN